MDLAIVRAAPAGVPQRERPVRRGPAPRHRRRWRGRCSRRGAAVRGGLLRGLGADQRAQRDDRDGRRFLGHARPSRLDRRGPRRARGGRASGGRNRPFGHGRARHSLRPSRRPHDCRSERLSRSPHVPPGPQCAGGRPGFIAGSDEPRACSRAEGDPCAGACCAPAVAGGALARPGGRERAGHACVGGPGSGGHCPGGGDTVGSRACSGGRSGPGGVRRRTVLRRDRRAPPSEDSCRWICHAASDGADPQPAHPDARPWGRSGRHSCSRCRTGGCRSAGAGAHGADRRHAGRCRVDGSSWGRRACRHRPARSAASQDRWTAHSRGSVRSSPRGSRRPADGGRGHPRTPPAGIRLDDALAPDGTRRARGSARDRHAPPQAPGTGRPGGPRVGTYHFWRCAST